MGLVTDLSPHLVRRALTSLRAELQHREHLLNRRGAKDLNELEQRGDPSAPPALVIVIDEFATLVGDVPEFVDGVVDVAQRGRSLGIHLIMATQRPASVIKDNLSRFGYVNPPSWSTLSNIDQEIVLSWLKGGDGQVSANPWSDRLYNGRHRLWNSIANADELLLPIMSGALAYANPDDARGRTARPDRTASE